MNEAKQPGDGSDLLDSIAREIGPSPELESVSGTASEPASEPLSESLSQSYNGPVDRMGRPFNSSIHSTNPDGSPRLTGSGHIRVKRGAAGAAPAPRYVPPEVDRNVRSAGVAVSRSFQTICTMMGGDSWRPSQVETEALDTAWAEYFAARGVDNVPPEMLLGIVLMGYAGPRLQQSPTLRVKLHSWYSRFRNGKNGTHADNRDNGERENGTS